MKDVDEVEVHCNGICLYGADIGVPEHGGVAYAHPGCPEHGEPEVPHTVCQWEWLDDEEYCILCEGMW